MDEADEMLNMGFTDSINAILEKVPEDRNTLMFSATMSPEISRIAKKYLHDAKEITIGTKNEGSKNVNHIAYLVHAKDKYAALKRIADYYPQIYGIIFCRTRKETQEINYEEEYEKRVYKKVWMDIAWYCGRNGRRIFVLAVCRLHHWDLPYHFFSCQQFHLGGGNGGIVAQFIYAGA